MKSEMIDKFATFITTAFGFVAGLAWNDAIKGAVEKLNIAQYGRFGYAIAITLIAVFVTIWLNRAADKAKNLDLHKELKNGISKIRGRQEKSPSKAL